MIEVFGRVNSMNVQKVMWAASELGLDWRRTDVAGVWGGTNDPGFVAMNPNRLVPVVRDGETVVWESHACVRYLCARYGEGGLWPADPGERARADMWMDWKTSTVVPVLGPIFIQMVRTAPANRDMAVVERAVKQAADVYGILDRWLEDRAFVAGDVLTMGDIPLGCATYRYMNLNIARPDLPNVTRWFRSLEARPGFRTHVMVPVT